MAMRIESVREKASETLEVALSGGLLFHFDAEDAERLGYLLDLGERRLLAAEASPTHLREEEVLSEESLSALRRLDAMHRARKDALSILSGAEQGSKQLYGKLLRRGYEPDISRACLKWLCDGRCVDDHRYVAVIFRSHMVKRGQGPDRIRALAWPRIGLFEDPKTILADCLASIAEDDMQEAIRRSSVAFLRRIGRSRRRGSGRRQRQSLDFPPASEDGPEATPQPMSFGEQRSLLRAHLKREGFPPQSIDMFLESWDGGCE
jgi:hypothetical protein